MSGVDAKALGRALLSGQGHGQAVRSVVEARHADLIDAAHVESASILERARAEAMAIVTAARADADRQREQARHDAEDAAREVAHGLRASMERDRDRVERAVRAVTAACEVLLDDVRHARADMVRVTSPSLRPVAPAPAPKLEPADSAPAVAAPAVVTPAVVEPIVPPTPVPVAPVAASTPSAPSSEVVLDLHAQLQQLPDLSAGVAEAPTIEQPTLVIDLTDGAEQWTPTPMPPPPPRPRLPRLPDSPPPAGLRRRRRG